ncbi:F-box protein At3g07870-like [Papaver somniferum]|uniref:F-box protein At3g07870-like n=1 Tax=Papaver somniferum TaxID=3469 RepID=UPI000E6FB5A8|nr:F-box protein At3g07870-like [Papaver somniferum]
MHLYHLNHPSNSTSGKLGFIALTFIKSIFWHFEYDDNYDESTTSIQRIRRINLTIPIKSFRFVGSCNRLICLVDIFSYPSSVLICNPITREYVILPKINTYSIGFGYVSSTNHYKVVGICVSKTGFVEVYIYTLGSGNGWRNLGKLNFEFNILNQHEAGIFANGALYWIDSKLKMIITFDLAKEQFCEHISPSPFPPDRDWCDARIWVLDGFLSFAIYIRVEGLGIHETWLLKNKNRNHDLKEAGEHQSLVWIKEFRVDDSNPLVVMKIDSVLTYSGHCFSIYDTKTSTSKRLVKFNYAVFQVYPHHNTLVSLKELGEEDTKVMVFVEIKETISIDYSLEQLQEDGEP